MWHLYRASAEADQLVSSLLKMLFEHRLPVGLLIEAKNEVFYRIRRGRLLVPVCGDNETEPSDKEQGG